MRCDAPRADMDPPEAFVGDRDIQLKAYTWLIIDALETDPNEAEFYTRYGNPTTANFEEAIESLRVADRLDPREGMLRVRDLGRSSGGVPALRRRRRLPVDGELDRDRIREEDFERYWEHSALMDPDLFLRILRAAGQHDAKGFLHEVDVPTLIVAAERDTFTPMVLADEMAQSIPNAELEIIEEGSHAAPVEQPRRVADRVEEFLATRVE